MSISRTDPILVSGAGGFIGGWLVRYLQESGVTQLRAVDIKPLDEWHQVIEGVDNRVADLRALEACRNAVSGIAHVYNLASDMGGMGFIEANRAACMISVLINTHLLIAGRDEGVKRHFYSSSACVYNVNLQQVSEVTALREEDAYPALPEDGYGWEKLFSERMCRNFHDDYGIETRVARYHNVYGPNGTYAGGREKAPAAICRKVAEAKLSGRQRDRDLGRRRADAQLHVRRRLPLGDDEDHGERHPRPDQPRLVRARDDQPARRHRRGDRRGTAEAPLQPRRAKRRSRAQLGQHPHPRTPWLGAEHTAFSRYGEDLRLDLRRAGGVCAPPSSGRRIRLMLRAHRPRAAAGPVISVIVYGRNDAHGYNLHRRAALSLNCIAEVLTDPDDEIVFVDYNTPDELPTFVEALADTLTDRCLGLLRVLRVPAAIHEQRFAARTHLPAIEPVARNAGVRRANPSNRWLLSTNTDMILLPHSDQSLSEICGELSDGFYGLPRFELPEWLWERLPRSDPSRAMADVKRLGPGLRLDEPTVSNEWIRFDAPGDFQLILREDFLAIDGLDEEMLLGYHVDSNLSRRMLLHRGSIESLGDSLAGYHCNHNREPTVYHGTGKVANDLDRFVVKVDQPKLPAQRTTWGLADAALEEVAVRERTGPHFAASIAAAIPYSAGPRKPSDAARVPFELTYDSGHVMPFVADSLAVSSPDATIGYMGANPILEQMVAAVVARLGFGPLAVAKLDDMSAVEELARTADVFVVDLGIDASLVDASLSTPRDHQPAQLPPRLYPAFGALERLVQLERARLGLGEHPRRFVLVHSWTVFWDAYVLANLECSHTTAHSRVRRGTVKPVPADDGATKAALGRGRRLLRWAARGNAGPRLHIRPREAVELAELADYGGFGDGWAYPDEAGIWTQGSRAELSLALDVLG